LSGTSVERSSELGEALLPGRQAALVGVDGRQVGGHIDALSGLRIDQAQIPLQRWVELIG